MPQIRFAPAAIRDLERLRDFLRGKNPTAAKNASKTILEALKVLGQQPMIGRPIEDLPEEFRDLVIDFGDSGYVARYRLDAEFVVILAVRHQRELGF